MIRAHLRKYFEFCARTVGANLKAIISAAANTLIDLEDWISCWVNPSKDSEDRSRLSVVIARQLIDFRIARSLNRSDNNLYIGKRSYVFSSKDQLNLYTNMVKDMINDDLKILLRYQNTYYNYFDSENVSECWIGKLSRRYTFIYRTKKYNPNTG